MTDLVVRLTTQLGDASISNRCAEVLVDAADELARLRAEVEALRADADRRKEVTAAWLFCCSKPGHRTVFASIERSGSEYWRWSQWEVVTRTSLVESAEPETVWSHNGAAIDAARKA